MKRKALSKESCDLGIPLDYSVVHCDVSYALGRPWAYTYKIMPGCGNAMGCGSTRITRLYRRDYVAYS